MADEKISITHKTIDSRPAATPSASVPTLTPETTPAVSNFHYEVINPKTGEVMAWLETIDPDIHAGLETALQEAGFKLIRREEV
jgi:hypothetical protein